MWKVCIKGLTQADSWVSQIINYNCCNWVHNIGLTNRHVDWYVRHQTCTNQAHLAKYLVVPRPDYNWEQTFLVRKHLPMDKSSLKNQPTSWFELLQSLGTQRSWYHCLYWMSQQQIRQFHNAYSYTPDDLCVCVFVLIYLPYRTHLLELEFRKAAISEGCSFNDRDYYVSSNSLAFSLYAVVNFHNGLLYCGFWSNLWWWVSEDSKWQSILIFQDIQGWKCNRWYIKFHTILPINFQ